MKKSKIRYVTFESARKGKQWRVRLPDSESRFFENKTDAEMHAVSFLNRRKKVGELAQNFSAAQLIEYREAKKVIGDEYSLIEAAHFFRKNYVTENISPVLSGIVLSDIQRVNPKFSHLQEDNLLVAYFDAKKLKHISHSHFKSIRQRIINFAKHFREKKLCDISAAEIIHYLNTLNLKEKTVVNYWGDIRAFLNWCKRKKYLREVPDVKTDEDLPKVPRSSKGVFSLSEMEKVLRWFEQNRPQFIPWLVLQAFAGIRFAEATRKIKGQYQNSANQSVNDYVTMHWDYIQIDRKRILIPAHIAKTNDDWVLQSPALPEGIFEWLAAYQGQGRVKAPWNEPLRKIRNVLLPAIGITWKHNVLRHTFCTMHITLKNSSEQTALLMRHTSPKTLMQNYLASLVPTEDAKRYFDLRPSIQGEFSGENLIVGSV